jgi:thioredoxin reductase
VLCDYIQDTSIKSGVHALTVYNTEVKNLRKVGNKWKLDAVTLSTSQSPSAIGQNSAAVDSNGNVFSTHHSQEFDAVVVASGHYHAARIPDIPGLADWKRQLPHRVQHSKSYRRPEDYAGKNFLLIGGSVSATDIARELGPFAQHIYQSHRNGAFDLPASLLPDNAIRVDEIASFEGISGNTGDPSLLDADVIPASVILKSGQKLCNIHHVIVCTGYHVTLPFLPDLHSDETSPEEVNDTLLVTDGNQLHNLHKDIFYIRDPSLVFVGVPYFTATFTLFEFQAMVVAKVLSGQVTLPNEKDMRIEYHKRVQSKGYGKGFHSLRDQEVQYVDELLEWVNRNLVDLGKEKLNGHTRQWHEAKEEQVERIKALFAAGPGPERKLETVCW